MHHTAGYEGIFGQIPADFIRRNPPITTVLPTSPRTLGGGRQGPARCSSKVDGFEPRTWDVNLRIVGVSEGVGTRSPSGVAAAAACIDLVPLKWPGGHIRPSTGHRLLRLPYGRRVLATGHVRGIRPRGPPPRRGSEGRWQSRGAENREKCVY